MEIHGKNEIQYVKEKLLQLSTADFIKVVIYFKKDFKFLLRQLDMTV